MCVMDTVGSWIRGNIYPYICCNSRANREPKVQRSWISYWECSLLRAGCYDCDSVDRPYFWSSSESVPNYSICSTSSLSVGSSASLCCSTGFCIHLCFFCTQRCLSSLHVWWSYSPFSKHWPGFCSWIPHHIQSPFRCHCCCNWHQSGIDQPIPYIFFMSSKYIQLLVFTNSFNRWESWLA